MPEEAGKDPLSLPFVGLATLPDPPAWKLGGGVVVVMVASVVVIFTASELAAGGAALSPPRRVRGDASSMC